MKFKKLEKLIKANLTNEELNQAKAEFDKANWSDLEIYMADSKQDNHDAWDSLIDEITWQYFPREKREEVDAKDCEKILGITFDQFCKNRDLYVQENELENKLEKYDDDFSELKRLTEDGIGKLNFDYEFIETLYAEKSQLETKIEEIKNKLNQIKNAIKQTAPKFKTWDEVSDQRQEEALKYLHKK